ncbi:amino acid ABC transporter substrate-binding protein [Streptomyces sp. WAC 01325]|uniref:ABC transporter substrate-binding protein n=1 Tax=Streptomyces TaxID=1883 RepID=UPI000F89CC41|nr:ABC transporter substrate-binding protein [Streptomyces sp. WAC 01325]RSM99981.1 amino acid ABC transporter substrate-binding protein [Streptomyces sp. WAC 01325]WCH95508.1 ABC transporter substrate-binding protein [Streptomyces moderatus]
MGHRSRGAEAAIAVLLLTLGTACGSRLPESDFEHRDRGSPSEPARDRAPIRVGVITSATSPVGGNAFTGPRDGAKAFFDRLNARGGIDGRRVEVRLCDDGGSGIGNNECVHRLIDEDKVVALVATTALDYAGASRVSHARVPDIGGQPIGAAYDTWPHLYGIYGSLAPRDGTIGWDGEQYGGTEVYRYFKREHGARTAAVVSYNQPASAAYARLVERGLKAEGYKVVTEQVDFALPNFRAVAADLKEQGADLVFDAIDTHGNARLCEAMDDVGADVTAKVTNVQNWTSTVAEDYKDAPRCRNALWATGSSRNFEDTDQDAVREFRDATEGLDSHSQWQLEGWAAAKWFTDAAKACAPKGVTRACVDDRMNHSQGHTAGGLLIPVRFERLPEPPKSRRTCLSVARWTDGRGWVSQGDMNDTCFEVPQLPYRP